MRILAVLPAGDASHAILQHLGLPTEPPDPCALAPPPPWFDGAVIEPATDPIPSTQAG